MNQKYSNSDVCSSIFRIANQMYVIRVDLKKKFK